MKTLYMLIRSELRTTKNIWLKEKVTNWTVKKGINMH